MRPGYSSPNETWWILWETLKKGASEGMNWWMCRPSFTMESPNAMWKLPATCFDVVVVVWWCGCVIVWRELRVASWGGIQVILYD